MIYHLEVDVNPIMHFNAKFWDLTLIVILRSIHQDQCSIDYSIEKNKNKQTNKQTKMTKQNNNNNNKTKTKNKNKQTKNCEIRVSMYNDVNNLKYSCLHIRTMKLYINL